MLILENGTGINGANSAINPAFVDGYLETRNRQTQNGWETATIEKKNAACIAATEYVENRWGDRFKGEKEFRFDEVKATCEIVIKEVAHIPYSPFVPEQPFVPAMNQINCPVLIASNFVEAVNGVDKCYDIDIPTLCPDFTMGTALFAGELTFINDGDQTGITYSLRYTSPEQGEADIIPTTTAEGMTRVVLAGVSIEPRSITLCANADGGSFDNGDEIESMFDGSVSRDVSDEIPQSPEQAEVEEVLGSVEYITLNGMEFHFADDAMDVNDEAMMLKKKLTDKGWEVVVSGDDGNILTITTEAIGFLGNFGSLETSNPMKFPIKSWSGGLNGGEQQTSFPRKNQWFEEKMPLKYLKALAEYAVRGVTGNLIPDPVVDESGKVVLKKASSLGPISESVEYAVGVQLSQRFKPYPEADILLNSLLRSNGGGVFR